MDEEPAFESTRNAGRLTAGGQDTRPHLIVFADDWGRHPSSAQHLIRHLLPDVHVDWINTIGTRAPGLDAQLIIRGLQKVGHWSYGHPPAVNGARSVKEPNVLSPVMYPGFRTSWQRQLNAKLLARFMQKNLPELSQSVVVSTIPIVADLPDEVPALRWIYYCVDDFSAWPGLDARPLQLLEELFVRRADRIIAAGPNLAARIESMGRSAQILPHGVDVEHWEKPSASPTALANVTRPIALFWGLIDRRLDTPTLQRLSRAMAPGTIVLVGPQQDPDPRLLKLSNVVVVDAQPFESLPNFAHAADVLIMPYAQMRVTQAMQPLKLREYLATGKPVVARYLPALESWQDCADITSDPEEFKALVLARACTGILPSQRIARARLRSESWAHMARKFREIIFGDAELRRCVDASHQAH